MKITRRELANLWTELDHRHFQALDRGDKFGAKAYELLRQRVASGGCSLDIELNPHLPREAAILEWAIDAYDADERARALLRADDIAKMARMCAMGKKDVQRSLGAKFIRLDVAIDIAARMVREAHRAWTDAKIKCQKLPKWAEEKKLTL